ncbi:MAG: hypothetical protein WAQ98_10060 [Blastocatellia bacterium]
MKSSIITAILFLAVFALGCDPNKNCTLSVGERNVSVLVLVPVSPGSSDVKTTTATSDNNGNISVSTPSDVPCGQIVTNIPGSPNNK